MDVRSLACFRMAYESGSIGKAAKRAYLSRQGLSGVLKSVEAELGQTLFIRGTSGLEPTEAARQVYPKVVELLETYEVIKSLCGQTQPAHGVVGLAIAYGALLSLPMDDLIASFEDAHSEMTLDVDIVEPVFAAQCVADGSKDIALVAGPFEPAMVCCESLCRVRLCAAVHPSLLATDEEGVARLRGLRWFGLHENFPFDAALEAFSHEQKLDLAMTYEWHDYHLILDQMRQGHGACIVPDMCAERFRQEGIVTIPLEDERLTWDICALTPRDRPLTSLADTTLAWLRSWFT